MFLPSPVSQGRWGENRYQEAVAILVDKSVSHKFCHAVDEDGVQMMGLCVYTPPGRSQIATKVLGDYTFKPIASIIRFGLPWGISTNFLLRALLVNFFKPSVATWWTHQRKEAAGTATGWSIGLSVTQWVTYNSNGFSGKQAFRP